MKSNSCIKSMQADLVCSPFSKIRADFGMFSHFIADYSKLARPFLAISMLILF